MTPPLTTVNVTAQPTLLYGGKGSSPTPMQVVNLDATHTVWIGNASNIIAGGTNAIPLGAGASAGFDGSVSVYGVTAGAAVSVAVTPGGVSYSPGSVAITSGSLTATINGPVQVQPSPGFPLDVSAAVVNIIPSAGFILPGQTVNLYSNTATTNITPGATVTFASLIDVSKAQSCDIKLNAFSPSQATVGAALTSSLQLKWFDDAAGNNLVYVEDVVFYLGNSALNAQALIGSAPIHGRYLTATVSNPSTIASGVNTTVNNLTITGSYRTPVYSSWRQAVPAVTCTSVTVANLTTQGVPIFTGNLGSINNQTPGTGLRVYLLPLYAGPVSYYWNVNTAALVNSGTLIDMSFVTSGNLAAGTSQSGLIKAFTNTLATIEALTVNFPRSPVGLVVNPAATSQIQFSAIGQQGY